LCCITRHKLGALSRQPINWCSGIAIAVLAGWVVDAGG
jgi:hypothetical protein